MDSDKSSQLHNDFRNIKYKSQHDWHLNLVLEDPEFIEDVRNLMRLWDKVAEYEKKDINAQFHEKSNDPKYADYRELISIYEKEWNAVKTKYYLTEGDLEGLYLSVDVPSFITHKERRHFGFYGAQIVSRDDNPDTAELVVTFSPGLTYEAYVDSWQAIKDDLAEKGQEIPKTLKRKRACDDPYLIYAIFKERQKGSKFKAIFSSYQSGNLEYYKNKSTNQFNNEDSLEAYYQKYKPEKQSLNH